MFEPISRAALGLLLLAISAPRSAEKKDWMVSTVSAMERIGLRDMLQGRNNIDLRAARGEYTAFQIVVSAGNKALTGVTLSPSDLAGPSGRRIALQNATLYREHYVHVTRQSPDPGWGNRPLGPGWYPDALIPLSPFDVAPQTNQPVWIDIYIPRDATPGTYQGTMNVVTNQGEETIRISLRVWNFELPLQPTLRSSFGMHEPGLSDRSLHELLLRHRIMPESVNPEDARDLTAKLGLNTTGLRFWSHFDKHQCQMDSAPAPALIAAALKRYPPELPVHLYSADEIDPCPQVFGTVREWAKVMRAANSRIQNLVTVAPGPSLFSVGDGTSRSAVDIWALLPKIWNTDSQGIEEARARGGQIWAYTALVQEAYSPKWEIDFAPINYRILPGFLAQSMGVTGILYWRVELWTNSPFQDVQAYSLDGNSYPGEGMLVYPGKHLGAGFAIPSMRLKWIRQGVQDYEYAAILKKRGRAEWSMDRIQRVAKNWRQWTPETQVLEAVRNDMGNEIERLTNLN